MSSEFDAKIDVDDDGTVKIFCSNEASAKALKEKIEGIAAVPEVGRIYEGVVRTIKDFGAFVQILPGQDGLCHISHLAEYRVDKTEDIVKMGDIIPVKVIDINDQGKIDLSLKMARRELDGTVEKYEALDRDREARRGSRDGDRGGRRDRDSRSRGGGRDRGSRSGSRDGGRDRRR